jgi:hypothetical protein
VKKFDSIAGGILMVTCIGACDSNSGLATNQVQGTVNGRAFSAKDAISAQIGQTNGFSFDGPAAFIQISDFAGACPLSAQDKGPVDSRIFLLAVAVNDSSSKSAPPNSPSTFVVHDASTDLPPSANVAQVYYGSGCEKDVSFEGTSGTVTLTEVNSDGSLDGTFDAIISCAGFSSCSGPDAHLTGSFHSIACTELNVNVTPTCS